MVTRSGSAATRQTGDATMSKVTDASLRRSAESSIAAITDAARDGRADRVASLAISTREVIACLPKKTRETLLADLDTALRTRARA